MTDDSRSFLPTAAAFRELRAAFAAMQLFPDTDPGHRKVERELEDVRSLVERHPNAFWREMLRLAMDAVKLGEHEVLLLRFPHTECTDGGRAISNAEPEWPETLTGEAARLYAAWQTQLHPRGFGLVGRIIEYPHGNMGDAGLYLSWQEDDGA